MPRYLMSLTMLLFLASSAWPQDENPGGEPAEETEEAVNAVEVPEAAEPEPGPEDVVAEEAVDDADLDLQTYEEDEDDFVPSEEIPADEPIPFPSNI